MKTLDQMSDLEKRTLASWIRRKMQGRVDPTILAERTDQELLLQYFQNIREKVSVKRTPSCKRVGPIALLRHDQARKEGVDEVAKTDPRTCA